GRQVWQDDPGVFCAGYFHCMSWFAGLVVIYRGKPPERDWHTQGERRIESGVGGVAGEGIFVAGPDRLCYCGAVIVVYGQPVAWQFCLPDGYRGMAVRLGGRCGVVDRICDSELSYVQGGDDESGGVVAVRVKNHKKIWPSA